MKKAGALLLTVGLAGVLAGCGSSSAEKITETPETQETTEAAVGREDELTGALSGVTLKIGTDTSFVPFCFPDENNEYTGFDIDLLKELSSKLGFEYELQPMDFTTLLMSVQSEKLDVGMAGITITPERKEVMDFSAPYYDAGLLVMVKEDNTDIQGIEDLAGKKVALKEGTSSVDYINENVQDVGSIITFPNIENAYMEVSREAADAVVYDSPNILYYLKINPESGCKAVGEMFDAAQYGIVFQKGSEYTELFDQALEEFKEDGTYDRIYETWFGDN